MAPSRAKRSSDADGLEVIAGLDDEHVADALGGRRRACSPRRRRRSSPTTIGEQLGVHVGDALRLAASHRREHDDRLHALLLERRDARSFTASAPARTSAPSSGSFALSGAATPMKPSVDPADLRLRPLQRRERPAHRGSPPTSGAAARVGELLQRLGTAGPVVAAGRERERARASSSTLRSSRPSRSPARDDRPRAPCP